MELPFPPCRYYFLIPSVYSWSFLWLSDCFESAAVPLRVVRMCFCVFSTARVYRWVSRGMKCNPVIN